MKNNRAIKAICTLVLTAFPGTVFAATPEKPNLVLIFADDLGWKDLGCQGGNGFETPNLDRFAREGMLFTAGYAAAGNCEPSRSCLMTGNYTPRHGVYAVNSTDRGPDNEKRLIPIPNTNGKIPRESIQSPRPPASS